MEIENVVHIEQPREGVISFDVIASCDVETVGRKGNGQSRFIEKWVSGIGGAAESCGGAICTGKAASLG